MRDGGFATALPGVVGREAESTAIFRFLADAATSAVSLVLTGPAGIGKSTLWKGALAAARERGFLTLETRAVETEAQLAFSGLADLLGPLVDGRATSSLGALPSAQRFALEVALQRVSAEGQAIPPLAVPLATLTLLRSVADPRPMILAVDDLPWLDAATAAAVHYVLRRVEGMRIGVLVAVRSDAADAGPDADALPSPVRRLHVGPLDANAIDAIVQRALAVQLRPPALRRIEDASGGNPFLALEIARALVRAGSVSGLEPLPLAAERAELVRARLEQLPSATLDALAAVAALSQPSTDLVARASREGGEGRHADVVTPAIEAGILEVAGERIRFTHPLLAAAAYARLDKEARYRLHGRLAAVVPDVEERARHLALSSSAPDAGIAAELDGAARNAWSRGTPATAAELMLIASQRTPSDAADAAARRMAAAGIYFIEAGDAGRARSVMEDFVTSAPPGRDRAEVLFVLADARSADSWEAKLALLDQALDEAGEDHRLRSSILEARVGARWVLCRDAAGAVRDGLEAVREAELQDDAGVQSIAYMQAAFAQGEAGESRNDRFIERAAELERDTGDRLRPRGPAYSLAIWGDRLEEAAAILEGAREEAQAQGDLDALALIEWDLGMALYRLGRWQEARTLELAAERRTRQTGQLTGLAGILSNRAFIECDLGNLEEARAAASEAQAVGRSVGALRFVLIAQDALGAVAVAEGDLRQAEALLRESSAQRLAAGYMGVGDIWAREDLAEALIGLGRPDEALAAVEPVEDLGRRFAVPAWRAIAARVRGVVAAARGEDAAATMHFTDALAFHDQRDEPFERARTLLARGETLRRFRQKAAARQSLEEALAIFTALPAPYWIARARDELARVGGRREGGPLSPTQQQVAELVVAGRTNREVADALFMSPHTVEAHLTAIYRALGVRGRTELARALANIEGSDKGFP